MEQPRPVISSKTLASWQQIVDLIAQLADVPASLVMQTRAPDHAVLVTSRSDENPYTVGQNFVLNDKLYCYGVIRNDGELVVEDATCTPDWADNDDLEHGMSFYVGLPLKWPDGGLFGTICVLDRRRNERALLFRRGLQEFAGVIEADLDLQPVLLNGKRDDLSPGLPRRSFFMAAGATVLFDPFRDDPSGAWGLWFKNEFPETPVDICMSTHTHFDHDAIHLPVSTMVLDRMVGNFEFADIKITGFADKHACVAPGWYNWTDALAEFGVNACPPDNVGHMDMVVYLVETGGIRTLIWGDNRHNPPEEFWSAVGEVDVLTLPVDGSMHILSYDMGNAIVDRLKPKVIIPTHYLNETTSYTLTTLQSADEWVKAQSSYQMLDSASLSLNGAEIAGMDREFMYFGHNALTA